MADNPNVSGDTPTQDTGKRTVELLESISKRFDEFADDQRRGGNSLASYSSLRSQGLLQQNLLRTQTPTQQPAGVPSGTQQNATGTNNPTRSQFLIQQAQILIQRAQTYMGGKVGKNLPTIMPTNLSSQLGSQQGSQIIPPAGGQPQPANPPVPKQQVPTPQNQPASKPSPLSPQQTQGLQTAAQVAGGNASNKLNTALLAVRASAGDPTAIVELVQKIKDAIAEKIGQLKSAGGSALSMAGSQRAGDIAGHGFAATESMGKFLGGPVGFAVEKVSAFGKALSSALEKLRGWGDRLHSANMQFAEFSASMALVQARQEMRDVFLSRERGERRAGSAEELAEARHQMNKELARIEDFWANTMNQFGSVLFKFIGEQTKAINKATGLDKEDPSKPKDVFFGEFLKNLGDTKDDSWRNEYETPVRFK